MIHQRLKGIASALTLLFTFAQAFAQQPAKPKMPTEEEQARQIDSIVNVFNMKHKAHAMPYQEVVTKDFITVKGMFTVHRNKSSKQWLWEIPKSLLGRNILTVTRAGKMPPAIGVLPGDRLDSRILRFDPRADSMIELQSVVTKINSRKGDLISRAVENVNTAPVNKVFPILAYGPENKSVVIDISPLITELSESFLQKIGDDNPLKKVLSGTSTDLRLVYMNVYPQNIEICSRKQSRVAESSELGKLIGAQESVGYETTTSFVALPAKPMSSRYADSRVGYATYEQVTFSDDQQQAERDKLVNRWRLEPNPADVSKWRKGQLVDPVKPIVIYLDPATPKKWRSYFIAGINDWQKAFERAGFKHAISGKEWPADEKNMFLDDARYSILHYNPSESAYAKNDYLTDPGSGEIVQASIYWSHQMLSQLRREYQVEAAANNKAAREVKFNDQLMGSLIRNAVAQQVGYVLGLQTNLLSTSFTAVNHLSNKAALAKSGFSVSIMNPVKYNYAAQPQDGIKPEQLISHIGDYDRWAIRWGYGPTKAITSSAERAELFKLATAQLHKDPRLLWIDAANYPAAKQDPRTREGCLGDDPLKAGAFGISGLKYITPHLIPWNYVEGGSYDELQIVYQELQKQYQRYLNPAIGLIIGVYYNPKPEGLAKVVYSPVSKKKKLDALAFLDRELFTTPFWLTDRKIVTKLSLPQFPNSIEKCQKSMLDSLLSIGTLKAVQASANAFGANQLTSYQYLATLHQLIWKEVIAARPVTDIYRRNIQRIYVKELSDLLNPEVKKMDPLLMALLGVKPAPPKPADPSVIDVEALVRADIVQLQSEIKRAKKLTNDNVTVNHLIDIDEHLTQILKVNKAQLANPGV